MGKVITFILLIVTTVSTAPLPSCVTSFFAHSLSPFSHANFLFICVTMNYIYVTNTGLQSSILFRYQSPNFKI